VREFAIGDVVDTRYQLTHDLGRGAVGQVFEAIHLFTKRRVAIKLITPDVSPSRIKELRERLQREAWALAAVRHPGIVEVLDGGFIDDGTPYIVMEKLEGRSLEGLLTSRGRFPVPEAVGIALQICEALAAAHAHGVVHRDLKPSNMVVVKDRGVERVKLIDFGIAQLTSHILPKLTRLDEIVGTPEYMAPEQLMVAEVLDARVDIYATGVTLFECLTGVLPYTGSYQKVLIDTATKPPPDLLKLRPDAGAALAEVVVKTLARERDNRYASASVLARALQQAAPGATHELHLLEPAGRPAPAGAAPPQITQQRRYDRAPYLAPLHIVLRDGGSLDARIEDISEGGILAIARVGCEPNQTVQVRFGMPIEGRIVTCESEVRWVRTARPEDPAGPRAIGIQFVSLPEEVRVDIARYVKLMAPRPKTD
jgi:eukaryotic-like serine/threonine-protein kinase